MSSSVYDAFEAVLDAAPGRRQSATAGELDAAPAAARAALATALRDAGYPDAMRSPQALGAALRELSRRDRSGTRWLARTASGRWFVGYGAAPSLRTPAA